MRLLFVLQESGKSPGGVVAVVRELYQGWEQDDQIVLLMNRNHPAFGDMGSWGGEQYADLLLKRLWFPLPSDWPVKSLPLKLLLRPLRWLQMGVMLCYLTLWLRRHGIDGVFSHNGGWPGGELNRIAIYAAWLAGIPKRLLVIHNTPWQVPWLLRGLYRIYGRMVGRFATCVITVSNDCRNALLDIAGFDEVDVIHNGIARTARNESSGWPSNHYDGSPPWEKRYPVIGFIGEMHPRKGIDILVDALKEVNSPCELVLVGNGDEAYIADIRHAAEALDHPVHFLGFREDVRELYRWMDIVVLPSVRYESFGMVIVEAMHASIPVICSDFGGMKEVVVDGETGLVVPAGDAHALAVAIERLLHDTELRERMGEAGRVRLEAHFTSEIMVKRYVARFHS